MLIKDRDGVWRQLGEAYSEHDEPKSISDLLSDLIRDSMYLGTGEISKVTYTKVFTQEEIEQYESGE